MINMDFGDCFYRSEYKKQNGPAKKAVGAAGNTGESDKPTDSDEPLDDEEVVVEDGVEGQEKGLGNQKLPDGNPR